MTLIKLHDSQLINGKRLSSLAKFDLARARHCFVFYEGKDEMKVDDNLNYEIERCCCWAGRISSLCEFPLSVKIVPLGAHFFTVKPLQSFMWTPAEQTEEINEIVENNEHASAQNSDNDDNLNEFIDKWPNNNIFDIPSALVHDYRFPSQLAQYVFNFLPINDILFTFRSISRAHYSSLLLHDNHWWKQRLTREYGSSVTRWSDATLHQWRSEWLTATTPFHKYDRRRKQVTDESIRVIIESQPVWFSAAVHLQCRLNQFIRNVMKRSEPELCSFDIIPAALRHVLLVAPPFQYCSKFLLPAGYLLWSGSKDSYADENDEHSQAEKNRQLFWFSYKDREERYVALYTGACYVKADQNTAKMGFLVEDEKNDVEKEEVAADDEDLMADEEIDNQDEKINNTKKVEEIREVEFSDPNLFPIFEWEPRNGTIRMTANCAHDFCDKRGVYRYCEKLSQMWNAREMALTAKSDKPIKFECDFEGDEDDADVDDEDNMSESDADQIDSPDQVNKWRHLSPPFAVRFDPLLQRELIDIIEKELNNDDLIEY